MDNCVELLFTSCQNVQKVRRRRTGRTQPKLTQNERRFNPKEDIASSTSIKTSIQRTIRSKLLLQIPLLSAPALPVPKSAKSTTVDSDDDSAGSGEEEEGAGPSGGREFGGGKKAKELRKEAKGRGPGKGKDAKKARKAAAEAEEVEESVEGDEEEDVLTLLDVLWPKKEGLTLIKWCVVFLRREKRY